VIDPRLEAEVARHPFPLLFVTVSGAHLYGFPSPDSDWDLRGAHVLPLRDAIGLEPGRETVEVSETRDGLEFDVVTHDVKKFFGLVAKKNGYVLEQIHSPLVVRTSPEREELRAIAKRCVTRHHAHPYLGFAATEWSLFEKEPRVKALLCVYRVLLTGIHLMRTGEVEADLVRLNGAFKLPWVPDLVARKTQGGEKSLLADADRGFHRREVERLRAELEAASTSSPLPDAPPGKAALNDLLIRVRTKHGG
jgi:hypothetical protein